MFDLQPRLSGTLVHLRPMRERDFEDLFAAASDPLIWELHPQKERYKREVFREYFQSGLDCGGALVALDAKSGRMIGSSRYFGYREAPSEIEIGWTFLARPYWGGVYNGEMKDLMLRHAFRFVESVIFLVGPGNLRSRRAMEKIGGVLVERAPEISRGNVVYQISRRAWLAPAG
jgi:RimJ/RimL family protein N-acetyltransferase